MSAGGHGRGWDPGEGGAARARKVTGRVIRTAGGPRMTIEFQRGLDGPAVLAALDEARARVAAEQGDGQAAA